MASATYILGAECIEHVVRQTREQVDYEPGLEVVAPDDGRIGDHLAAWAHECRMEVEQNINGKNNIDHTVRRGCERTVGRSGSVRGAKVTGGQTPEGEQNWPAPLTDWWPSRPRRPNSPVDNEQHSVLRGLVPEGNIIWNHDCRVKGQQQNHPVPNGFERTIVQ